MYNISATNTLQDEKTHFVTLLTITTSSFSNSIMTLFTWMQAADKDGSAELDYNEFVQVPGFSL